ncbi:hypothetical protein TWF132_005026 [Orbilia oligospora]|nr:hypothetical protein TWF128_003363 [Orbilia oligospora]KAF3293025.1 hypothetical protein TWF132_005026 [Orbilia oligospora]
MLATTPDITSDLSMGDVGTDNCSTIGTNPAASGSWVFECIVTCRESAQTLEDTLLEKAEKYKAPHAAPDIEGEM